MFRRIWMALAAGAVLAGCYERTRDDRAVCDWRIVAAEQSSRCLVMYSGAPAGELSEIWRWDPARDPNLPPMAVKAFASIDEAKPIDGGQTVLTCASGGGVGAVDVATCRAKWFAYIPEHRDGPHSLAVLPDGRIAGANSVGVDALQLGDRADAPVDPARQRIVRVATVPGAHGVSWDTRRGTLFVLGYTNVFEYAYSSAQLSVKELRRWNYATTCGDAYGHDLVPDGCGGYWFSNHSGVWRLDPDTGGFTPVLDEKNVKSFSRDAQKGDLLVTPRTRWWTDRLTVRTLDGASRTIGPIPSARFYKARWLKVRE